MRIEHVCTINNMYYDWHDYKLKYDDNVQSLCVFMIIINIAWVLIHQINESSFNIIICHNHNLISILLINKWVLMILKHNYTSSYVFTGVAKFTLIFMIIQMKTNTHITCVHKHICAHDIREYHMSPHGVLRKYERDICLSPYRTSSRIRCMCPHAKSSSITSINSAWVLTQNMLVIDACLPIVCPHTKNACVLTVYQQP